MGILGWIILGGIAGWIASLIMGAREGLLADIAIGIVGGLLGGFLFSHILRGTGVTGFNLYSLLVAVVGAVILLAIVHAFWHPGRHPIT